MTVPLLTLPGLTLSGLALSGALLVSTLAPAEPTPPTPRPQPRVVAAPAFVRPSAPPPRRPASAPTAGAADPRPAAPVAASPWRWPLALTPRVLARFRPPPQRWAAGHRGVDLAAAPGDTVLAAGAGVVTFAGPLAGRGVVTVRHGSLRTTYEPVTATVAVGDQVRAGAPIGTLAAGVSHCGGVPSCLHWGLRRGADYLDPLVLIGLARPILLPLAHDPVAR